MSLALKAAAGLLGLPEDFAAQLPELAAQLPEIFANAESIIANVQTHVETVNQMSATLARIERKLDVLGVAVIQLMEKQNVVEPDAATGSSTHNGNNCSTAVTIDRHAVQS